MSLLSWAREKFGWGYSQIRHGGGENWAGKSVTADGAMNLSAWWRGVKLLAEVTGAASLKFYERLDNDDRKQIRDHPIADLISFEPNIDQTTQEFWGSQAAALAIFGNAYAEKLFVGSKLVALQPLPYSTHPFRDPDTDELKYRFAYGGKTEILPRDKVFHTKGFSLGGDLGISPLSAARQALSISLATEQSAGATFAQGLRASGFLSGPTANAAQRDQIFDTYLKPLIGNDAKAHYGILPPEFSFQTINIPPKDAEMLLSRRFNLEEIARYLGMPPILLGHSAEGVTQWGSGVENIILSWLTLGLDAFWRNIELSINKRLLTPGDRRKYYAEFDRTGLMRADTAATAEFMSKLIQNGVMTPNQGRKKFNWLPMTGGDVLLINSTLIPLQSAGKQQVPNDNVIPFPKKPAALPPPAKEPAP